MKKNIEKPNLGVDELKVFSASFMAIWEMGISEDKTASRKIRRKLREFIASLAEMIALGAWEEALRIAFKNDSFELAMAQSLRTLINASREDYEDHGSGNDYETIKCGAMKIAKAYEYMTGKDAMTGKKLHKGVLDAD